MKYTLVLHFYFKASSVSRLSVDKHLLHLSDARKIRISNKRAAYYRIRKASCNIFYHYRIMHAIVLTFLSSIDYHELKVARSMRVRRPRLAVVSFRGGLLRGLVVSAQPSRRSHKQLAKAPPQPFSSTNYIDGAQATHFTQSLSIRRGRDNVVLFPSVFNVATMLYKSKAPIESQAAIFTWHQSMWSYLHSTACNYWT